MKPLTKLLGAIAIVVASGSVLATERSSFTLFTLPDPADWMLLSGLAVAASIARRRSVSVWKAAGGFPAADRGRVSARAAGHVPSPTGPVPGHQPRAVRA